MPSRIDPDQPADGVPVSKAGQRANWAAAKAELEHGGFVIDPSTGFEAEGTAALANVLNAAARVFDTIATMRSWTPLPGCAALALGYSAPGDGGGGLFFASDQADMTDGGVAFGATADESDAQTVTVPRASFHGYPLPHQNLVFGSVEVALVDGVVLTDLDLHGHRMNSGGKGFGALVEHRSGALRDPNAFITGYAQRHGASTVTVRYRYLTSPNRWVRAIEGDGLRLKWFGAVEGADCRDRLCWALNAAARLGKKRLRLDGSYRYRGTIELPDGVELTDGSLKVTDGGAVAHYRLDYDEREPCHILGGADPLIVAADGALSTGLRRVELDGNWEGNRGPWDRPAAYDRPTLDNYLRNSPIWNGFATTNHGDRVVPVGQRIVLEDAHIHGFGGNCLLGHVNARWQGRSVRLGNSLWNHLLYGCDGVFHDLALYGFWRWGGMAPYDNLIHGLRVDGLTAHPFGEASINLLGYRGLDHGDGSPPALQNEARQGCRIDGFHIDLAGATFGLIFGALGAGFSARDGVVLGRADGGCSLFQETGNGYQTGLNAGWELATIVCLERGHKISITADKNLYLTNGHVRNVTIKTGRGYAEAKDGPQLLALVAARRGDPGYDRPQSLALEGVVDDSPRPFLFRLETQPGAAGLDVSVRDCLFRLTTNTIFQAPNGQGVLASLPDAPGLIRVFFERCTFVIDPALGYAQNRELFLACSYFRACSAWWNGVREDVATRWGAAVRGF